MLRIRMTTHAMRCIDKAGGVDMYLLQSSPKELNSDIGIQLKGEVERKLKYNKNNGISYLMDIQKVEKQVAVA